MLQLYHGPTVCECFAFGPAFEDLLELESSEFRQFLGVVVEASTIHLMYQSALFHGLPLLRKYL